MFVPQMCLWVFTRSTSFPVLFEQRFVAQKKWCNLHAWPESWGVLRSAPKKCVTAFQGNKSSTNVNSIKGFCWKNYEFQIPALLFFLGSKNFGEGSWSRFNHLLCNEIHGFFHVRDTSLRMLAWGCWWTVLKDMLGRPLKCCVLLNLARRDSNEYFTICPNANRHLGCRDAMVKSVASAIFAYPKNDSNAWKSLKQGLHDKKNNRTTEEINVM